MELKDLDWWDTSLENKMGLIKAKERMRKSIELEQQVKNGFEKLHHRLDIMEAKYKDLDIDNWIKRLRDQIKIDEKEMELIKLLNFNK